MGRTDRNIELSVKVLYVRKIQFLFITERIGISRGKYIFLTHRWIECFFQFQRISYIFSLSCESHKNRLRICCLEIKIHIKSNQFRFSRLDGDRFGFFSDNISHRDFKIDQKRLRKIRIIHNKTSERSFIAIQKKRRNLIDESNWHIYGESCPIFTYFSICCIGISNQLPVGKVVGKFWNIHRCFPIDYFHLSRIMCHISKISTHGNRWTACSCSFR